MAIDPKFPFYIVRALLKAQLAREASNRERMRLEAEIELARHRADVLLSLTSQIFQQREMIINVLGQLALSGDTPQERIAYAEMLLRLGNLSADATIGEAATLIDFVIRRHQLPIDDKKPRFLQ
jgi:hypothetical protein